jgi:DNA polymerase III subunit delta'
MTGWPPELAGTPAAAVIERAIAGRRLGHSLLLHGGDPRVLAGAARAIAARLLAADPAGHPDSFALRPAGKMRQITAEATRELIAQLQMSPAVAPTKVAVLHEADRMNAAAANIFLKTLEEPPPRTVLLLLTARPYSLLATIRSRCFHFRLPSPRAGGAGIPDWADWLADYRAWLGRLSAGPADKAAAADAVLTLYGLLARFGLALERATEAAWESRKESLPADLDEDERVALETGLANGQRALLLAEVEEATRDYARSLPAAEDQAARRSLPAAVGRLERAAGLLRFNLNESAALEDFLLASLRIWSRR